MQKLAAFLKRFHSGPAADACEFLGCHAREDGVAVSTSEFIKDRLAVIESELGNVDSDISSYKSAHMVPDIEQASQLYFNRAAQASDEVAGLNNRLSMANYIRSYLTNSANSFNVLPANAGLENFNIESQIQDYNKHLLERNNLVENSSTSNPLVVDLDNQLAGMRQAILQSIDNYVVTLKSQVRTAESSRATASVHLQANPTQARYLLSVERQQKVKESDRARRRPHHRLPAGQGVPAPAGFPRPCLGSERACLRRDGNGRVSPPPAALGTRRTPRFAPLHPHQQQRNHQPPPRDRL